MADTNLRVKNAGLMAVKEGGTFSFHPALTSYCRGGELRMQTN